MAATDASADQFGSGLGGSHFLATNCFWHHFEGWGCVTAKVDTSKSAVCGPNQLISLGPLFLCRKSIWQQNIVVDWSAVACRKQDFCRQQLTKHRKNCSAKLIFYIKIRGPKEISWFGPQTADLEGSTLAVTQPHPSKWCQKQFVAKKMAPTQACTKLVSWCIRSSHFKFWHFSNFGALCTLGPRFSVALVCNILPNKPSKCIL